MVTSPIRIESLDHVVLTVTDLDATINFYVNVLGMRRERYLPGRWALSFGRQKLNLHIVGEVVDENVRHATPGSADLCLLTDTPMADVLAHLEACDIPVITGPVGRTGATGPIESVYFYDPDENLLEIANPQQS